MASDGSSFWKALPLQPVLMTSVGRLDSTGKQLARVSGVGNLSQQFIFKMVIHLL
jgi:hypothetical protein